MPKPVKATTGAASFAEGLVHSGDLVAFMTILPAFLVRVRWTGERVQSRLRFRDALGQVRPSVVDGLLLVCRVPVADGKFLVHRHVQVPSLTQGTVLWCRHVAGVSSCSRKLDTVA